MPVARFRIRTLMIAVAVVGVACCAFSLSTPSAVVAAFAFVPLAGVWWSAYHWPTERLRYLKGAFRGAVVQAMLLGTFGACDRAFQWSIGQRGADYPLPAYAGDVYATMAFSVAVGIGVGLVAEQIAALIRLVSPPVSSPPPCGRTDESGSVPCVALRLPRITARQCMVAAAVVGLCVAVALWCRVKVFRERQQYHLANCRAILTNVDGVYSGHEGDRGRWYHRPGMVEFTQHEYAVLDWHAGLAKKYGEAADRPWLPVPRGPPPPE